MTLSLAELLIAINRSDFQSSSNHLQEFLSEKGITPPKAGVHAGFSETSLMLCLRPDLVAMELARPGLIDEAFYRPENISRSKIESFIHGVKSQAENGVLGDPVGANSEIGREIFERKVEDIVEEIENNL